MDIFMLRMDTYLWMYVQHCYDNKLGQNRASSLQYPHTCRGMDQLLAASIKDEITVSYTAHYRS